MWPKISLFVFLAMTLCLSACNSDDGRSSETPTDTLDTSIVDDSDPRDFIDLDCESKCKAMEDGATYGTTAEQMVCALDLCGDDVVLDAEVKSLYELKGDRGGFPGFEDCVLENMARTYKHFGDPDNELAPKKGDSYVMLATGPVTQGAWSNCDDSYCYEECMLGNMSVNDQWLNEDLMGMKAMGDPITLELALQAPQDANAFRVRYVFMSTNWDQNLKAMHRFISEGNYNSQMYYDDKFYIMKNEVGGSIGTRELINYTDCRWPEFYWMRECTGDDFLCDPGEKICPVSVLSGMGECCWFECDRTGDELDVSGTGFECAVDAASDNASNKGSSTGWLETQWTVEPGEKFEIIFHIHDASGVQASGYETAVVLIDSFEFIRNEVPPGTSRPD